MNNDNFIVIQGWMCNELNLKGNELLVFALIYGFSQDEQSEFSGSRGYIANTFNISLPTVDKSLKALVDRELITKRTESSIGIDFNYYKVNLQVVKKLYRGCKETLYPYKETLQGGSKETLHYIDNNKNINKNTKDIDIAKNGKSKKKQTKQDKILKFLENGCLLHDIEDENVIELLEEFYIVLIDNKKMVTQHKIDADLDNLAKVDTTKQIATIKLALSKGWQSLNPEWLSNSSYKPEHTRLNDGCHTTEKEIKEFQEKLKNNNTVF